MTDIVDDTGMKLTDVATPQLLYMRDLPRSDPKWEGCPYSIDDVKVAINAELEKRGHNSKEKPTPMDSDSQEFQDASQAAAEKIRNYILEVAQSPGQNNKTALTGALASVAELSIQFKPDHMSAPEALSAGVETVGFYGIQYLNGHAIDADRPENLN